MSIVLQGSTSGSVTLQEPAVAGTTVLTLPAVSGTVITTGTTGQVIDSGALPIGSVLQVVSATTATTVSNSTGTYADTGLTATITPKFSTSKILVMATINGTLKTTNNTNIKTQLVKNSTAILAIDDYAGITGTTASNGVGSISCNYLDSPATTSATTYKVQFASDNANAIVYVQGFNNVTNGSNSTMVLMEIAQ